MQRLIVDVEGIGILHQELACAHHPEARADLVAELGLHLVEVHRQLLVAGQLAAREVAGGSDNSDLFLEDKEAEARNRLALERENAAKIPGMLKPSQIVEEDEEL